MKKIIFSVHLLLIFNFAIGQNKWFEIYTDAAIFKQNNDALIKDFENQAKKIDPNFDFKGLKTVVQDSLPYGFYTSKEHAIYLPLWETSPRWTKDLYINLTGSQVESDKLAGLFFNGFFMPHEIAHGLQYVSDNRKDNQYDNELEASRIAYLYWKKQRKNEELNNCYQMAKSILSNLKNPFPENVEKKKYFTEHYRDFIDDLPKYIYVILSQITDVFEDKSLPDFDTYLKNMLQKEG